MSTELTEREREYLACEIPMTTGGQAARKLIGWFFVSLLQAAFTPGSGKSYNRFLQASKGIRYTRYKKAVIRKEKGEPRKKDEKLLAKLNKNDFVYADETYDADEYARKIYEEYMKNHGEAKS